MTIQEKFDLTGRAAIVTGGVGLLGAGSCFFAVAGTAGERPRCWHSRASAHARARPVDETLEYANLAGGFGFAACHQFAGAGLVEPGRGPIGDSRRGVLSESFHFRPRQASQL